MDWKEDLAVRMGDRHKVIAVEMFFAELALRRHTAVIVGLEKGRDAFLRCHNVAWES